tara:strand:+ start:756 stop:884 length:129 start_codon:yes stop_codon:yes gene_type:complete
MVYVKIMNKTNQNKTKQNKKQNKIELNIMKYRFIKQNENSYL